MKMSNKLFIDGRMSAKEWEHREMVNRAITQMIKRGVYTPDTLRNYLLNNVYGVEVNGITYVFPSLEYDEAVGYYKELTEF